MDFSLGSFYTNKKIFPAKVTIDPSILPAHAAAVCAKYTSFCLQITWTVPPSKIYEFRFGLTQTYMYIFVIKYATTAMLDMYNTLAYSRKGWTPV